MATREPVEITVETGGGELIAGTLWIHDRGGQTATFRYADSYLANPDAFLRSGRGWALSPAYDLNPSPDSPDRLSTAIDLDDTSASIENAPSVSRYFRLTIAQAREVVAEVEEATSGWRHEAEQLSLPRQQTDRMADAFETSQRGVARRA